MSMKWFKKNKWEYIGDCPYGYDYYDIYRKITRKGVMKYKYKKKRFNYSETGVEKVKNQLKNN